VHQEGHWRSSQIGIIEKKWRNDQEKNASVSGCHSPGIIAAQISSRFTRVLSEAADEGL